MDDFSEQVKREDILMFVNACFACSGQQEFYEDSFIQNLAIDFLHEYMLVSYRNLYAYFLAVGINHFNQSMIIINLLSTGKNIDLNNRQEENNLITQALRVLPPQRAYKIFSILRKKRVNNRRTKAIFKGYINSRPDINFDAVKYRTKFNSALRHTHLKVETELGNFLFKGWKDSKFTIPIFDYFQKAHYSKEAIYNLPFTVAEGLASKWKIPRDVFMKKIKSQMTFTEKFRMQDSANQLKVNLDIDLKKMPLTKLVLYILSFDTQERLQRFDEFEEALNSSAKYVLKNNVIKLGKVAAVLDCSYSTSGSHEKQKRPLGIALAINYLLKNSATEYKSFWTIPNEYDLLVKAKGQTDIASPLIDALEWNPDTVIIISDGYDNSPIGGVEELMRVYKNKIEKKLSKKIQIIHLNPVFSSENYLPKSLSKYIVTLNLREAEDLFLMLNFARFSDKLSTLSELENYLKEKVQKMSIYKSDNSNFDLNVNQVAEQL